MTPLDDGYDPADDSRKSFDLCISELRKQFIADRTVKDKTALLYPVEEDGQLYVCIRADEIGGLWRFPVTPEKMSDFVSEGARLVAAAIRQK